LFQDWSNYATTCLQLGGGKVAAWLQHPGNFRMGRHLDRDYKCKNHQVILIR